MGSLPARETSAEASEPPQGEKAIRRTPESPQRSIPPGDFEPSSEPEAISEPDAATLREMAEAMAAQQMAELWQSETGGGQRPKNC